MELGWVGRVGVGVRFREGLAFRRAKARTLRELGWAQRGGTKGAGTARSINRRQRRAADFPSPPWSHSQPPLLKPLSHATAPPPPSALCSMSHHIMP